MAEREFFSGEGANQGRPINIYQELIDECAYRAIWRYSPTTMHDVLSAISEDIREEGDSASQEDTFNVVWAFRVIAVSRIDWRHTLLDLPEYNRDEVKHPLPYVYHQFRQQQNLWGETGDELSLNHFQAQALCYALEKAHLPVPITPPPEGETVQISLRPLIEAAEEIQQANYFPEKDAYDERAPTEADTPHNTSQGRYIDIPGELAKYADDGFSNTVDAAEQSSQALPSQRKPMDFLSELATYEEDIAQQRSSHQGEYPFVDIPPELEEDGPIEPVSIALGIVKDRIDARGDRESRDTAHTVFWAFHALIVPHVTVRRSHYPQEWQVPWVLFRDEFRQQQEERGESGDELLVHAEQLSILSSLIARLHLSIGIDAPPEGEPVRVSMIPLLEAAAQTEQAILGRKEQAQETYAVNRLLDTVFPDGFPPEEGTNDQDHHPPA